LQLFCAYYLVRAVKHSTKRVKSEKAKNHAYS